MGPMNVFVPVSEELMDRMGLTPDDLVPFELDYEILRPGEDFDLLETRAQQPVPA
jgi:hypothetical protein